VDHYVNIIREKAASRLYFVELMKRAAVPTNNLSSFSVTVIRPVLEYGARCDTPA